MKCHSSLIERIAPLHQEFHLDKKIIKCIITDKSHQLLSKSMQWAKVSLNLVCQGVSTEELYGHNENYQLPIDIFVNFMSNVSLPYTK